MEYIDILLFLESRVSLMNISSFYLTGATFICSFYNGFDFLYFVFLLCRNWVQSQEFLSTQILSIDFLLVHNGVIMLSGICSGNHRRKLFIQKDDDLPKWDTSAEQFDIIAAINNIPLATPTFISNFVFILMEIFILLICLIWFDFWTFCVNTRLLFENDWAKSFHVI